MSELLTLTFGPEVVVAKEFTDIEGVELVVIYGSWARRYHGELGTEPADVDVMITGKPDRGQVYDAAERAEARLRMPVNPTVRSSAAWSEGSDPLVRTAKQDALTVVDHSGAETA